MYNVLEDTIYEASSAYDPRSASVKIRKDFPETWMWEQFNVSTGFVWTTILTLEFLNILNRAGVSACGKHTPNVILYSSSDGNTLTLYEWIGYRSDVTLLMASEDSLDSRDSNDQDLMRKSAIDLSLLDPPKIRKDFPETFLWQSFQDIGLVSSN